MTRMYRWNAVIVMKSSYIPLAAVLLQISIRIWEDNGDSLTQKRYCEDIVMLR